MDGEAETQRREFPCTKSHDEIMGKSDLEANWSHRVTEPALEKPSGSISKHPIPHATVASAFCIDIDESPSLYRYSMTSQRYTLMMMSEYKLKGF